MVRKLALVPFLFIGICCTGTKTEKQSIGSIERLDSGLSQLIGEQAKIEVLSDGHEWTEGPVWIEGEKMLLFSDIPKNTIYKWTQQTGTEVYLTPSGYTGTTPSASLEPGSNGLLLDKGGNLILCQHGDRRVAKMEAPLGNPRASFTALADQYEGKKLNSPNDAVYRSNGDLFFTDPPYGLPNNVNDSTKEVPFQGVYKISANGKTILLVDSLTRPNGIALTPDEKTLIVANSDPEKIMWYAFDLAENDSLVNPRIFYDGSSASSEVGLPDGLKVDRQGNIFATGPGGVWIFSPEGKLLGKIRIPVATANCALADEDKTLYLTADNYLLRVRMR